MKRTSFKTTYALSAVFLSSALVLGGCSGDSEESQTAQAPAPQQAMDVKQPEPDATPKEPLQPAPKAAAEVVEKVESEVAEVKKQVETKVEAVKTAAASGQSAYSTCIGCHGANGEGGVGPRLNNQTVEDIVTKLEKYKAGEQIGPMTAMMAPMAKPLSTETMQAIAEYITNK